MNNPRSVEVELLITKFPACIECSEDHLSKTPTYFHKAFCLHGAGLTPEVLGKRLSERFEELEKKNPLKFNLHLLFKCRDCLRNPTGTGWVSYHSKTALVEIFYLCDEHSYFEEDRPHGFIPGHWFKSLFDAQQHLAGFHELE